MGAPACAVTAQSLPASPTVAGPLLRRRHKTRAQEGAPGSTCTCAVTAPACSRAAPGLGCARTAGPTGTTAARGLMAAAAPACRRRCFTHWRSCFTYGHT